MSTYDFRLCTAEEKPRIIDFMDDNWGSKHPLLHVNEFFDFYYDSKSEQYKSEPLRPIQFAVACEDEKIIALVGYIYTCNNEPFDIWVSIWCAVKGKNGIGLELMSKLPELTNCRVMACNNIRPKTIPFYTFLGYTADKLSHYYRILDKKEYVVAQINNKKILKAGGSATLELINTTEQLQSSYVCDQKFKPCKDLWYIKRRYFNYPLKTYEVYGVRLNQNKSNLYDALLITHTATYNETNILRIVDYIGKPDLFAEVGSAINNVMLQKSAEYADCYCYGISEQIFELAGFCKRDENDLNIIPNYLDPPVFENTDYYFFTSNADDFTMFKADGDQDRPNIKCD